MTDAQANAIVTTLERIAETLEKQTAIQIASTQTANEMFSQLGLFGDNDE